MATMDKELNQAKYRRVQIARDQFGRPWAQIIEVETGDPCAGNGLPDGWVDRIRTPNSMIRVPRDRSRRPIPGRCHIDFDRWIVQLKSDLEDWRRYLYQVGKYRYKKTSPEEVRKWETDDYLLEDAGPKPGHHLDKFLTDSERESGITVVKVLERARDGDSFLLGLDLIPGLEPPTEITWPVFMSRCTEQGKTREEASVLWAIQKAERSREVDKEEIAANVG